MNFSVEMELGNRLNFTRRCLFSNERQHLSYMCLVCTQ